MVKEVFIHLAKKYFGENRHLMNEAGYASPISSVEQIKNSKANKPASIGSLKP